MIMQMNATISSVIGQESHTPVIFNNEDSKSVTGMMTSSPLKREMICAGTGLSVEAKKQS